MPGTLGDPELAKAGAATPEVLLATPPQLEAHNRAPRETMDRVVLAFKAVFIAPPHPARFDAEVHAPVHRPTISTHVAAESKPSDHNRFKKASARSNCGNNFSSA